MSERSASISGCGRVDTHHHFLPSAVPELTMELGRAGPIPTENFPRNPQDHLKFMDEHDIQTAILSASIVLDFAQLSAMEGLDLCERAWKAQKEYVKVNPLRFGSFAMLPFPYVDETMKFIESVSKDDMVPDGFTVATSLGGRYLGDEIFEPVWAALDKLRTTVFVHPIDTVLPPNLKIPPFVLEFTFDTARCILSIILSGILTRYPNVRFIFSHNGGVYPYVAHRSGPLEPLIKAKNNNRGTQELMKTANIYFDTAISYKSQFSVVKDLGLPAEHIVYGSDHPYTTAVAEKFVLLASESPANSGVLSEDDCATKIARENALNLFPRLKKLYREEFPEYYKDL